MTFTATSHDLHATSHDLHYYSSPQLMQGLPSVQSGTSNDPCVWVDRITAVFRACTLDLREGETHPCQPVVDEVRLLEITEAWSGVCKGLLSYICSEANCDVYSLC